MTVLRDGNFLNGTVQIGSLIFKALILIRYKFPWYMLTPLESTFLWQICIYSLTGFWMSVMASILKVTHSRNSLCQYSTLLYGLVWKILLQCSSLSIRWSSFYSVHEYNSGGKLSQTKMELTPWCSSYNLEIK